MIDIKAIIKLIEEGSSNSDHRDGQGQINKAVAMLRDMEGDGLLHSGQRGELSQILGCGPLYGDIEKAVRELKEKQGWLPIETAPKDGTTIWLCPDGSSSFPPEVLLLDGGYAEGYYEDGEWLAHDLCGCYLAIEPAYWMRKVVRPSLGTNGIAESN